MRLSSLTFPDSFPLYAHTLCCVVADAPTSVPQLARRFPASMPWFILPFLHRLPFSVLPLLIHFFFQGQTQMLLLPKAIPAPPKMNCTLLWGPTWAFITTLSSSHMVSENVCAHLSPLPASEVPRAWPISGSWLAGHVHIATCLVNELVSGSCWQWSLREFSLF